MSGLGSEVGVSSEPLQPSISLDATPHGTPSPFVGLSGNIAALHEQVGLLREEVTRLRDLHDLVNQNSRQSQDSQMPSEAPPSYST